MSVIFFSSVRVAYIEVNLRQHYAITYLEGIGRRQYYVSWLMGPVACLQGSGTSL